MQSLCHRPAARIGSTGYRRCLVRRTSWWLLSWFSPARHFGSTTQSRVFLDGFGSVDYWVISTLLSAAWLSALAINGAWDRKILGAGPSEYGRIMRASLYFSAWWPSSPIFGRQRSPARTWRLPCPSGWWA